MNEAIIRVATVAICSDSVTIEVVAEILEGMATAGMNLEIVLNRSTRLSVPILQIIPVGEGQIKFDLYAENLDEAILIAGLNFVGEMMLLSSP